MQTILLINVSPNVQLDISLIIELGNVRVTVVIGMLIVIKFQNHVLHYANLILLLTKLHSNV